MKKSFRSVSIFLLVILVLSTVLAGCGQDTTDGKKYLRIAEDVELSSMDQHIATDGLAFEVISATIEGLYSLDADGNVIPAIAESEEVSEDGLVYTFNLREDVKWSNGTSVTANDFVFSWRRLIDPNTASEYNFIGEVAGLKNASAIIAGELPLEDLGVEAVNDYTLKVTLERPVPFFKSLMAFGPFSPLNEDFVKEQGESYALEPSKLLSNGPYKMVEWNKGYGFKLDKNPDYYDAESVKVDGLEYRVIKDYQTAALKYESNEIDVVKLSAELVDKYSSNEGFTSIGAGYLWYAAYNQGDEIASNLNVRKAISHAINKEHITDNILNDGSIPADYIVPVGLATGPDGKDFRETTETYSEYNLELAKEYWDKAKSELGKEQIEIEILLEDSETIKKMAEFMQADLETNLPGLSVSLKIQPKKNRLELMRAGDYQIGLTRWGPDYADPLTYLELFITESGGSPNNLKYSNAEYDQLVYDASRGELAGDPEGRWEAMKEAEKILLEQDAAVSPLYQTGYAYLINPKVSGIENHAVGTPFIYKNVEISE